MTQPHHLISLAQQLPTATLPPALTKAKAEAQALLTTHPLPATGQEDYQKYDITALLAHPWQLPTHKHPLQPIVEGTCPVISEQAIRCFMADDQVQVLDPTPQGTFIGTLSHFATEYPHLLEQYFGSAPTMQADTLTALNTLLLQEALVVYLSQGVTLQQPIHIVHYSATHRQQECITSPRFLFIAEPNTSAAVLICDHALTTARALRNSVMEVYAAEGSHLMFYDLEESRSATHRLHQAHIVQGAHSKVLIDSMTIQNGSTRNNYHCTLQGPQAVLDLDGLCILDGEQVADNWCKVWHNSPHCTSDQLFKYTVNDNARGNFAGMIYVAKDAQKTVAYQNNRNLLLAPTARMYSKPQLEIYADDVKCSHGMTTGELSQEALFYLQQRGIPKVEAQLMLTIAFMSDVLEKIEIPSLRKRLSDIVEARFRGVPARCQE